MQENLYIIKTFSKIMKLKEQRVIEIFRENKDKHFDNREIFYMIRNYKDHFKDQDECDNTLAKLIREGEIDKKRIHEDKGIFKFNKNLEEAIKT